ncbi:PadR family transcriptional regulator [Microbacterium oleivorans]|uniref:PadR family transcriptional regulator n=1 Tax=Microbacterium oleivorans TaxID=273677 RepID=UPI0010A2C52A|nr:PadR family transcriptional regulator [Microbacterium oleivorans]THE06023.1 PadR family transcriptional regulator [Microbacterium oleivorans]
MASPLGPTAFWILTALAGGRRHGYDILREVDAASSGRAAMKVTTLYAALERLEREGLIRADGEEVVGGRARRYFAIEDAGGAALLAEITALEHQARVARERLAAARRPGAARPAVARTAFA